MRQKLLNMLVALTAMAGSATAQTLSIAPIEAEAGAQAELVVTGASLSNAVTALQFNLTLPQGVTLDEAAVTKGAAASGHELSVSTLDGGARLFVLYNMNLDNIQDGELLRLPVSIGSDATDGNARLTTVRFASSQAVSTAGQDATAAITVTEPQPEGFSNQKLYTLTCKRGALVMNADGTGLAAGQARTDAPETDKRFAIITYNDAQYLYSPVQKQFLLSDGSFASRLGSPVSFDDSHPDGDYTYMLTMQNAKGETLTFNNNGKIVINDWGTPDDGNRWRIEPVADFDPTEALALAAKQTCVVTYQVQYDGQPVASATEEVAIGSALPAVPARLTGAFVTLTPAGTLPTTVDTDVTISYTAVWNGPFAFSKSEADAHWYNMHIRGGYYVGKQATEPYYPAQVAEDVLKTKEYHWAFGGTPYRIVVYNRATGFAETLTKDGGNAVMRPGEYFWEILPNADGFVLREEGTANNCVNQNGGSEGPLQFWSNASSSTDNGSTFRVEEARELETGIGHLDVARPRAGASALYDLSGRRVYQPTQRGIYISNRRKVAVR